MNVLEAIYARRAIRAYEPRPVPEETIRTLLRAAVQAPSAMNAQPWIFGVVQCAATLKRWSDRAKTMLLEHKSDPHVSDLADMLRSPEFNVFYDASTLVVIGAEARGTYTEADCWLAAGNLMLAAREMGLGSCPIGFATQVLNTPDVKEELRLGKGAVAVAAIILGYPRGEAAAIARKAPRITAWLG